MRADGATPSVLITDLDGVVRLWDPQIIAAAELRNGLPPGALARAAFAAPRLHAAVTGAISDGQWRSEIAADLVGRFGTAGRQAVREWSSACGTVNREVLEIVRRWRGRGRVALLSNATTRLPQDLHHLGVRASFDLVFNSSDLGVAKPDPAVYRIACERLGVAPEECIFVDDTAEHVQAATLVGMVGHHYTGPHRLAEFIEHHQPLDELDAGADR